MISDFLLEQIASETKEKIAKAEIVIDGVTEEVQILRKDQEKNLLKIFVNTTKSKGLISDIRLLDDKGRVLLSKPSERIKNVGYALVSSFYIRFVEEEIKEPISIFELRGAKYGEK